MDNNQHWQYIATSGFVARMADGVLEMKRLDNDQWEAQTDPALYRLCIEDGKQVTKEEAYEIHAMYKKEVKA